MDARTISSQRKRRLREFARPISLRFLNFKLLDQALTHSSYAYEQRQQGSQIEDNEKLEFLGDSVLGQVVALYLYENYPLLSVGECSKIKAEVVSAKVLTELALKMKVADYMNLGRSAARGAHSRHMGSILADCFEAILGAVYLATNLWNIRKFILLHFKPKIEEAVSRAGQKDYKSMLQERVQRQYKIVPSYRLLKQSGPEHDKTFLTRVFVGKREYATGRGHSKKEAEQNAAQKALERLG